MSKQRPSSPAAPHSSTTGHWRRRVFKNTYTRGGRCFEVRLWSVKIQHQGTRRTFSLAAKNRAAAAIEAQAIYQTIVTQGWDTARSAAVPAPRARWPNPAVKEGALPKTEVGYWKRRLLRRRHATPRASSSPSELSVRVEHAGAGHYFPLETANESQAAARALEIYLTAVQRGWNAVYQSYPRELTVAFHWSANPLAWTYATFHTETCGSVPPAGRGATGRESTIPVVVVEPDASVRRAIASGVNRQPGFACRAAYANAPDALAGVAREPARLLLVDQSLPEATGTGLEGRLPRLAKIPLLFFSVYEDSDHLFKSTPGGAAGYLLKRTPPNRLFEPIAHAVPPDQLSSDLIAVRVRRYFQSVVDGLSAPDPTRDASRLTHREHDILKLLSKGSVDKEIADNLGISVWTVHGHLKKIFEKLGVHTRTEAAIKYLHK
jgi:DNA-binding NarL/FixJ family response regulator